MQETMDNTRDYQGVTVYVFIVIGQFTYDLHPLLTVSMLYPHGRNSIRYLLVYSTPTSGALQSIFSILYPHTNELHKISLNMLQPYVKELFKIHML